MEVGTTELDLNFKLRGPSLVTNGDLKFVLKLPHLFKAAEVCVLCECYPCSTPEECMKAVEEWLNDECCIPKIIICADYPNEH